MATSGSSAFTLDLVESVEEAYERAGLELRTGYDMRTARRSINLLALEWANQQVNLWTVEQASVVLVAGTAAYDLPADTIDVLDMTLRTGTGTSQTDITIERTGVFAYSSLPNKNSTGRPVQVWIDRQTTPRAVFWPVPDSDDYTFVYYRMRRIQDAGSNGDNTLDIPTRFLPAFIAGLAYHIAVKRPEAFERLPMLKVMYDEAWATAAYEDRERVALRIVPARRRV